MGGYPPEGDSDKKQIQRGVQAVYRLRSLFHSTEKYCLEKKNKGSTPLPFSLTNSIQTTVQAKYEQLVGESNP